VAAM
jgi:hypothetical protein